MKLLFVFLLHLQVLCATAQNKYITKKELDEQAADADKSIRFISNEEFDDFIAEGYRFVFFGVQWCKFCKR